MSQGTALEVALAHCREPQATEPWCTSMDAIVTSGFRSREEGVDAVAEAIRAVDEDRWPAWR